MNWSVFRWWVGTLALGLLCSVAVGGLMFIAWGVASSSCWDSC